MNELKIFNNPEFGKIRTAEINGEPWFVGKDVATILGYNNTNDALAKHVDPEDKKMGSQNATPSIKDNLGREQWPTFINESGLYALVLSSKLPTARKFSTEAIKRFFKEYEGRDVMKVLKEREAKA